MSTSANIMAEDAAIDDDTGALFSHGLSIGASDWHLSPGQPLCLRVNGSIVRCDGLDGSRRFEVKERHIEALLESHSPEDRREDFRDRAGVHVDTVGFVHGERFRFHFEWVSSCAGEQKISAVLRHIPKVVPEMGSLGLPYGWQRLMEALPANGLVLVTGSSCSGKTTTLAASINYLNQHCAVKVTTLEAPVEFFHESVRSLIVHRSVGIDVPTFQKGIEAAMRADPDIIVVGEMRDLDTITAALSAAETGHLVFASLHTNAAPGALSRILDSVPEGTREQYRSMLAGTLRAVLAQRLVPRIEGGRIAAFEFMVNTPAVASQIRENKIGQLRGTIKTGKDQHMVSLDQSLKRLVAEKKVSREMALEYAENRGELEQELRTV